MMPSKNEVLYRYCMTDKLPTADEAYEMTQDQIVKQSSALFDRIVDALTAAVVELLHEASVTLEDKERYAAEYIVSQLIAAGYVATTQEHEEHGEGTVAVIHFSWGKAKKK
jgi:hypothetical protein